jgi:subtilisin-like proprotein convertase family protein
MMPDLRRLILLSVVSVLASLAVTASASAATLFTNPAPIKIPASGDFGVAAPYPSEIAVSGLNGPITNVTVTLHRFGHTHPTDVDILLVSPAGDTVMVMSDACFEGDIEDFTWTFSDQAPRAMSIDKSDCGEFTYRPTNHDFVSDSDTMTSPAPPGPYGTSLASFNNENPNGTWKLFVRDDFEDDVGDIEGGWSLSIETGPVDTLIPGSGTSGTAIPYPASRTISGHTGVISDLNVIIDGISHERPDDLDLLLVGPQGEKVVLMSDACGSFGVSSFGWEWNDEAAAPMPDGDTTNVCSTRSHRPANYGSGDFWPAPAPAGPYAATLSAFDFTNPNGEWRLFVQDDAAGATGFFTNRFQLQLQTQTNTKPTITNVKPAPGSKTRDRTPLIAATVLDAQTGLAEANIRLFVDGKARSFSYDATTDRLDHQSTKLKAGRRHTVRIEANDGVLNTTRSWSFKVIQRR